MPLVGGGVDKGGGTGEWKSRKVGRANDNAPRKVILRKTQLSRTCCGTLNHRHTLRARIGALSYAPGGGGCGARSAPYLPPPLSLP